MPLNIRIIATSNRDMAEAVARVSSAKTFTTGSTSFPLPFLPCASGLAISSSPSPATPLPSMAGVSGRTGMSLSPDAEAALSAHAWPGNIRELENVIQRALIMAPVNHRAGSPESLARTG